MKRKGNYLIVTLLLTISSVAAVKAQVFNQNDSLFSQGTPKTGRIWGYAFGDYYTKQHSDSLVRGGNNQYTGVKKNENAFAFRRIYLGYDYNISKKFSTELLLAAEDNATRVNSAGGTTTSGDLLSDNKYSFYIKLANVRWKGIWKGTDLVIGQSATPAFSGTSEKAWGYRSVERTIADIRRTPSFDLGVALQGRFDKEANYGYDLMVGNGNGDVPENDKYKWFYGDLWAKFFDKKLTVSLYGDYERLNWEKNWHHSRNMIKAFVGYTNKGFSIGAEGFMNKGKKDVIGISSQASDTLDATALGLSVFARTNIVAGKVAAFARADFFNPDNKYDNQKYMRYQGFSSRFEANTKETFMTAGIDFTPIDRVHIIPNVWYNSFKGQQANLVGAEKRDYDLVYRITFNYVFGNK